MKATMTYILLSFLFLSFVTFSSCTFIPPPCRFASLYSPSDLLTNETIQQQFLQSILYWEGQFIKTSPCSEDPQDYVGYNVDTGMTYDGHRLHLGTCKFILIITFFLFHLCFIIIIYFVFRSAALFR